MSARSSPCLIFIFQPAAVLSFTPGPPSAVGDLAEEFSRTVRRRRPQHIVPYETPLLPRLPRDRRDPLQAFVEVLTNYRQGPACNSSRQGSQPSVSTLHAPFVIQRGVAANTSLSGRAVPSRPRSKLVLHRRLWRRSSPNDTACALSASMQVTQAAIDVWGLGHRCRRVPGCRAYGICHIVKGGAWPGREPMRAPLSYKYGSSSSIAWGCALSAFHLSRAPSGAVAAPPSQLRKVRAFCRGVACKSRPYNPGGSCLA